MILLHQIGERINSNFNTLEEIVNSTGPISFDGIYESVYENYKALKGKDITFFVSGKYVGSDNTFDLHSGQPLSNFCTYAQILEMRDYLDAKIGYHGWAHLHCHRLTEAEIRAEIAKPDWMVTDTLAWPYGDCNELTDKVAKEMGYKEAWSVTQGNDTRYQKRRKFLNW